MNVLRNAFRAVAVGSTAALIVYGTTTGALAAPTTVQVGGLMTPDRDGACTENPESPAAYVVSGTLTGCWYIDSFAEEHNQDGHGYRASGAETFSGCLEADQCGHFHTTFTFTAKFVGDTEAHGRCHHPIVGGDGYFSGVSGVINEHDLPDGCAEYRGHLDL